MGNCHARTVIAATRMQSMLKEAGRPSVRPLAPCSRRGRRRERVGVVVSPGFRARCEVQLATRTIHSVGPLRAQAQSATPLAIFQFDFESDFPPCYLADGFRDCRFFRMK
jgi:hypothetical protein